jgi:hypothetical protein
MRDLLLFMLVGIVFVVGVWSYFGQHPHVVMPDNGSFPSTTASTPAPTKKAPAAQSRAAKGKRKNEPAEIKPERVLTEAASVRTAFLPKRVRTVEPEAIKSGTAAAKVIELLGPPDLRAATSQHGKLVETYFYSLQSRDDLLLIHLRGGQVEP